MGEREEGEKEGKKKSKKAEKSAITVSTSNRLGVLHDKKPQFLPNSFYKNSTVYEHITRC